MRNEKSILNVVAMPALLVLVIAVMAVAGPVDTPNTFTPGTVADANAVNANFSAHADAISDNDARIGDTEVDVLANEADIASNQADVASNQADIATLESEVDGLDARVTTLEGAQTGANIAYDNSTSGLAAANVQAAIDEIVATPGSSGQVFIRWGNTSAPTGTTKLYDGIGMGFPDGGAVFVMKGGDPGTTTSEGGFCKFLATDTSSSRMPPGITENRRIVGAVCYSNTPTTVIYGTHAAPTGWSILYKGYVLSNDLNAICVDADNFDATHTAGTESGRDMTTIRISGTHDATNYPNSCHIRAAVIAKN